MPVASRSLACVASVLTASPCIAADRYPFDLAAASLGDALARFAQQGHISIGVSDQRLVNIRVRAVRGNFSVETALAKMLKGTGLSFRPVDKQTYHIIAAPRVPPARRLDKSSGVAVVPESDIVVTASKRDTTLGDFPATISILKSDSFAFDRSGTQGTDAIVGALPSINSTHLGPGRNKLFIRGVADSSFTGPTQATVGQYLGDVRLTYNAPDPDLTLYDVDRVEILEGPQGALYGTASLGGIIRIIPNAPNLNQMTGSATAGLTATQDGALGDDIAAMVNVPVASGKIGVRGVAYRSIDGGYINDTLRGLTNINRSKTEGGRLNVRFAPGDNWTIDVGGLIQNINNADSQYAEHGQGRLKRASAIAQPFDNDYMLGQFVIAKHWDELDLVSATGIVRHDVAATYDATPLADNGRVTEFTQSNRITLISHETRLSRTAPGGINWLVGASIVSDAERLSRTYGPLGDLVRITGVKNTVLDAALFGEATWAVSSALSLSVGGRVAYTRQVGEALDIENTPGEPRRNGSEILPSLAATWRPNHRITAYVRYQEGFRPGGLSVANSESGLVVKHFEGDGISTYEAGFRYNDSTRDALSASVSISYGHWETIQADLIDNAGLPFSANIGTGNVIGIEFNARWRPTSGLSLEAGALFNDSKLSRPAKGLGARKNADLPNISNLGGRVSISYATNITDSLGFSIDGSARYVGRSKLGVGALAISQGKYTDTVLRARLNRGKIGLSAEISNIFNTIGNRFSLGNPFGVMQGQQTTPLRPRAIRIGLDASF